MAKKKGNRPDSASEDEMDNAFGGIVDLSEWADVKTYEPSGKAMKNGSTKKNNRDLNTQKKEHNKTREHQKKPVFHGEKFGTQDTTLEEEEELNRGGYESNQVHFMSRGRGQLPLLTSFEAPEVSHTGRQLGGTKTIRTVFAKESEEELRVHKMKSREVMPEYEERKFDLGCGISYGMPISPDYSTHYLPFPERPKWTRDMTAKEMDHSEETYMLEYLRQVYNKYDYTELNHFEHNLDVWRQLWRVCEQSDILLLVSDARLPLLHFNPHMWEYCKKVGIPMVLVLNKVDTLPVETVKRWKTYFETTYQGLYVVVFSSYPSTLHKFLLDDNADEELVKQLQGLDLDANELQEHSKETLKLKRAPRVNALGIDGLLRVCREVVDEAKGVKKDQLSFESERLLTHRDKEKVLETKKAQTLEIMDLKKRLESLDKTYVVDLEELGSDNEDVVEMKKTVIQTVKEDKKSWREDRKLQESLLRLAGAGETDSDSDDSMTLSKKKGKKAIKAKKQREKKEQEEDDEPLYMKFHKKAAEVEAKRATLTIGTVGLPNAGKSSLVNALTGKKVVSVSRQPGHTKRYQTLLINEHTVLCDCPGLVFPACKLDKSLQVLAGIFPIPQTREPCAAVKTLARAVPLDQILGLEKRNDWSAFQLCEELAKKRGFCFSYGRPDVNRAAQLILYGVVDGRLQFYLEPPTKSDVTSTNTSVTSE